jgi:Family of unknown function (DUF5681)
MPEPGGITESNLVPPWKPGESGNPSGRPRSRPFRNAMKRVFLARVEFQQGDARGKTRRLDALLLKTYMRALKHVDETATLGQLMEVMPLLHLLRETLDPKELAASVEGEEQSRTFILGGKEVAREETRTLTKTVKASVELTGGANGGVSGN